MHLGASWCDPSDHFTGVSGPSGPKIAKKKSQKESFMGSAKNIAENTRKTTKKTRNWTFGGLFLLFQVFLGTTLQTPQKPSSRSWARRARVASLLPSVRGNFHGALYGDSQKGAWPKRRQSGQKRRFQGKFCCLPARCEVRRNRSRHPEKAPIRPDEARFSSKDFSPIFSIWGLSPRL